MAESPAAVEGADVNVVILLGAPGSGKGTLAGELTRVPGIRHLSSGDLLRGAVKAGTPAGIQAKAYMEAGNLVPDELITQMIDEVLAADTETATLLLDGFPRTVRQADMLAALLEEKGVHLRGALLLSVPDDVLVARIAGRRVCPACGATFNVTTLPPKAEGICDACGTALVIRKDDDPSTVRHRLDVYAEQTMPLIDYYRQRGLLHEVDGTSHDLEPKVEAALRKIHD